MNLEIRAFDREDTEAVVALWHTVGLTRPWNDPHRDIERKLAGATGALPRRGRRLGEVVGSVMAGYDGHRGWLYYLASDPTRRGEGIGRALVGAAEERLVAMGCPKVQLMVRPENDVARGFYGALDYEPFDTWATGKRLIPDVLTRHPVLPRVWGALLRDTPRAPACRASNPPQTRATTAGPRATLD